MSRTSDPRDGFYTYVSTTSNYRDWPWMALNGDWLIVSHQGAENITGPVATMVSMRDLRSGARRPEYLLYLPSETGGAVQAEPMQQYGSLNSHSQLTALNDKRKLRVISLPHPTQRYGKRAAKYYDAENISDLLPERTAYRDGYLHLATHPELKTGGVKHRTVKYYRIPVAIVADAPVLTIGGAEYRELEIVPPGASASISNEEPLVQVNGAGDVMIAYGRSGYSPDPPNLAIPQESRYVLWRHGSQFASSPQILAAAGITVGTAAGSHGIEIKALGGGVDPVDDHSFWVIHKYDKGNGNWGTFLATVQP